MAIAGRVAIVPKGDWSNDTLYEKLDAVYYLGSSYLAKKSSVNILPTDTEYWMLMVTGASDEQINQLIEDITALSDEVDSVKEDIANLDASDVGAVPIEGGMVSGRVAFTSPLDANCSGRVGYDAYWQALQLTTNDTRDNTSTSQNATILQVNPVVATASNAETSLKDAIKVLRKVDGTLSKYTIFGEHNKPTGTYTGNGDATSRTINVGGIGSTLLISRAQFGMVFVFKNYCYIIKSDGSITQSQEATFLDGILTIKSNGNYLNANGGAFPYQVL